MTAVGDDYRARLFTAGYVDHHACISGILNQSLDRRRIGRCNGDDSVDGNQIAIAYVYEFSSHLLTLFDVLNLLADLLQLALHVHNYLGDVSVDALGSDGVGLTVHFL